MRGASARAAVGRERASDRGERAAFEERRAVRVGECVSGRTDGVERDDCGALFCVRGDRQQRQRPRVLLTHPSLAVTQHLDPAKLVEAITRDEGIHALLRANFEALLVTRQLRL